MTEQGRRKRILGVLADRPFASVRDLVALLDVSPATVRRDLDKLHEAGEARKVFGGIALLGGAARTHALPFGENSDLAVDAKAAIAECAAALVQDGDMVIVASGSTCYQLGVLLSRRPVTIHTNSMPLAAMIGTAGVCQMVLSGGTLHREPGILYDHEDRAPDFNASRLFLGAQGLCPDGVMESHPLIVRTTRMMLERTDEVIVLADSRKLAIRARHLTCPVERISTVITDEGISTDDSAALREAGVRVVIAQAGARA
ncbi:DeoR/GlpR family DNA-binding transcription regulator [Acetobacteraceae bacterium KSS8]|uniref:DeoR/GlpR family DNA-binding transcription regulator n=1 Tax=Endosaccharibacter trunci TaxID=2812733 RepID=A0ABT1W843_9PROT|nr:DeoR/GlpR family DNA-binding transcription regulator [Acetobacteraceae bacterium KSS8]